VRGRLTVFLNGGARTPAAIRAPLLACAAVGVLLAAGCGGGTRQDHGERSASYALEVVHASFPSTQAIARPAKLELEVRNSGSHAVPELAISLDSLNYRSNYPGLADRLRPTWVIERGPGTSAKLPVESQEVSIPGGAQTAYVNTWALGRLPAGRTARFVWSVVPVKSGTKTVHYTLSAGLGGKARARLANSGPASGKLTADIAGAPPDTHVDPATGKVVTGAFNGVP
jgi:hypothetical protein